MICGTYYGRSIRSLKLTHGAKKNVTLVILLRDRSYRLGIKKFAYKQRSQSPVVSQVEVAVDQQMARRIDGRWNRKVRK